MRHVTWALAALALAAGCKKGPTTGKEFVAKMNEAEKKKDVDAMWNLISKKSRASLVDNVKKQLESSKSNEKVKKRLQEELGVTDPAAADPETVAKKFLGRQFERDKNPGAAEYVEEKIEGDQVILVTREPGKERDEVVLIREDGVLRIDIEATDERESKKYRS